MNGNSNGQAAGTSMLVYAWVRRVAVAIVSFCMLVGALAVNAADDDDDDDDDGNGRYCSATARLQLEACQFEAKDDSARSRALCINLPDRQARRECLAEARTNLSEAKKTCHAQHWARRTLCQALGEARYAPDFDAANFQTDFRNPKNPNPYFPLRVGNRWEFEGDGETIVVKVLDQTKLIEGVTCVVVNDRVEQDGVVVEDTDDWFALRHDRTVDYCGESVRNYEVFPGDRPQRPELVDVDGSWKAGRDGDLPGTQFLGTPKVGAVYRQEFSPGNAEDAAEVVSTTYGLGRSAELDAFVPPALVQLLCSAYNCVVTREFTPIEPGAFQRKYYAPGIGLFLEVTPRSGDVVRLVDCNVDPKCAAVRALR